MPVNNFIVYVLVLRAFTYTENQIEQLIYESAQRLLESLLLIIQSFF